VHQIRLSLAACVYPPRLGSSCPQVLILLLLVLLLLVLLLLVLLVLVLLLLLLLILAAAVPILLLILTTDTTTNTIDTTTDTAPDTTTDTTIINVATAATAPAMPILLQQLLIICVLISYGSCYANNTATAAAADADYHPKGIHMRHTYKSCIFFLSHTDQHHYPRYFQRWKSVSALQAHILKSALYNAFL